MSNESFSEYKLGKIINCSLEENYLQRIGYSKLFDSFGKEENLTNAKPKASITTVASILQNNNKQYYIKFNDNDLYSLGFSNNLVYKISGSKKGINNMVLIY